MEKSYSQNTEKRFVKVDSSQTGMTFINTVPLPSFFKTKDIMFTITAGGTAAGDLNNDGLIDVVFTGAYTRNKVFLNKGNFHFEEKVNALLCKDTTGMSFGVSIVDVNGDGWNDVFV
ncbi:MAG TPA: VCBS repeat-containing protein, partial [Candidatus Kapabacteria bacterium]|nr:VCBS repeat-containing protein [Candidatus Kapabacteria bacterium]